MTKLSTTFASIALLAFAFVMPACDFEAHIPCDPSTETCAPVLESATEVQYEEVIPLSSASHNG